MFWELGLFYEMGWSLLNLVFLGAAAEHGSLFGGIRKTELVSELGL